MEIKYYDIGLNLFCKQFPDPEKIIEDAEKSNVVCILTGTDRRENEKIDTFTRTHHAYGTVGIHPHNADSAKQEDFLRMEELAAGNEKIVAIGEGNADWTMTGCFPQKKTRYGVLKNILFLQKSSTSRCFCMSARRRRILWRGLKNTGRSVGARWYIVLRGTGRRWRFIFPWDFQSGLRDGSAMRGVPGRCAKRCAQSRSIGYCLKRMRRTWCRAMWQGLGARMYREI